MAIASIIFFDTRNFTSTLPKLKVDQTCKFLKQMHNIMVDVLRFLDQNGIYCKRTYISSTGDGALILFLSKSVNDLTDVRVSFLFTLICRQCFNHFFNNANTVLNVDKPLDFGMALHRGRVLKISEPSTENFHTIIDGTLDTYIGDDINITARIEATNPTHGRTRVSMSEMYANLLLELQGYTGTNSLTNLIKQRLACDKKTCARSEITRTKLDSQLQSMTSATGLIYMGYHTFKNVNYAINLYRLSEGRISLIDINTLKRHNNDFIKAIMGETIGVPSAFCRKAQNWILLNIQQGNWLM